MSIVLSISMRPQLLTAMVVLLLCGAGFMALGSAFASTEARQIHTAAAIKPLSTLQAPPSVPAVDCSVQACMALTFDDGPFATHTLHVLSILERHQVRATFFVVGVHVHGNEALLRYMYQNGHEIGNHSWDHSNFTKLTTAQMYQQIDWTQAEVARTGVPAPKLFRPPYGAADASVRQNVPLTFAMWNIDPEDWRAKKPQDIVDHVRANAKPGGVVDLHDVNQVTIEALDPIITDLKQHYKLVTFSEMFNLPPGQQGTFYGR
ncbi:MAG TPA: polysaccharide deacetylase family protein [Candidatus Saccharimonadales bacterium]|nr:polysaccharide deacetylase family protein [Candidatus Saccharimonadales bacterium]